MDQSSTGKEKQQTGDDAVKKTGEPREPALAPTSDPTNPHNQEATGDWVANSRASERRNNEPGLASKDRRTN